MGFTTHSGVSQKYPNSERFIKFLILDKDTGLPVSGATVEVVLGDKTSASKITGQSGLAWFTQIPEGPCDLASCSKGCVLFEEKRVHTMKKGEGLVMLAATEYKNGNKITDADIAAFNWGEAARDQRIMNECMRDILGCHEYDGWNSMAYTPNADSPHTLSIPRPVEREGLAIEQTHTIRVAVKKTVRQFLGCAGIPNVTFDRSKSFINPTAAPYLKTLKKILGANPSSRLMIFGHADKRGEEDDNTYLSERRARSVYALLVRDTKYWLEIQDIPSPRPLNPDGSLSPDHVHENWGLRPVQIMLNFLNPSANLDLTGTLDSRTVREIETYQVKGRESTVFGDKIPRSSLEVIIRKYMDRLMDEFVLSENDFLPLKHAGCGEFNPLVEDENDETADSMNRRVTFFLFDKNRPPQFPCVAGDTGPCRKQAEQYGAPERHQHNPCFTCAFYDSIAKDCEIEGPTPDIIAMDSHMHFMSGHCTPLPVLWVQFPFKIPRGFLDWMGNTAFRKSLGNLPIPKVAGAVQGSWYQSMSSLDIAKKGMDQTASVYNGIYFNHSYLKNGGDLYTPLVAMSMDMLYAHYDGYKGMPIYHLLEKRKYALITQTDANGNQTEEKVPLWPDFMAQGRDDIMSEAAIVKKYGTAAKIGYETKGSDNARKEGFYFFWARDSQLDAELEKTKHDIDPRAEYMKRKPVWLGGQERDLFEDWPAQREAHILAAITYPLQVLPMYHYDPRRWSALENSKDPVIQTYTKPGNWDEPFADIATPDKPGTFVGFKMYTALGYKPLDSKLSRTLHKFYEKCETEGIPVLCHCSPDGGVYSVDRELHFKMELEELKDTYSYKKRHWLLFWRQSKEYWMKNGYYDEYVKPSAWEPVLKKFPKLKLCLAHFGGGSSDWKTWSAVKGHEIEAWYMNKTKEQLEDVKSGKVLPDAKNWIREIVDLMATYENFYTDISYHYINDHSRQFTWLLQHYPHIKDRIMFGTDWYMTALEDKSIGTFVTNAKTDIDAVSRKLEKKTGMADDLWLRFSRVNPMAFYGLKGIAEKLKEGLEMAVGVLNGKPKNKAENTRKSEKQIKINESRLERNLDIIKKSDLC